MDSPPKIIVFISLIFFFNFVTITAKKAWSGDDPIAESETYSADSGYYQSDAASSFDMGSVAALSSAHLPVQQKCVEIPQNMSLCYGIGYTQMLLPNLLDHDSIREASEQSSSWIPLANIKCHQHTQLFLCSLFAPICPMQQPQPDTSFMQSDQPLPPLLTSGPTIYPCRSLCESVRTGCMGVMSKHGFPWPDFLTCSRFPVDNDMCISPNANGDSLGQNVGPVEEMSTTTVIPVTKYVRSRKPSNLRLTTKSQMLGKKSQFN